MRLGGVSAGTIVISCGVGGPYRMKGDEGEMQFIGRLALIVTNSGVGLRASNPDTQ